MAARVLVESRSDYESWLSGSAASQLGRNEWEGVCAKCHGPQGEGGYGPAIANSTLLTQTQALRTLLVNGQNQIAPTASYMPPVARGWTNEQFDALTTYLKDNIYKAPANGG